MEDEGKRFIAILCAIILLVFGIKNIWNHETLWGTLLIIGSAVCFAVQYISERKQQEIMENAAKIAQGRIFEISVPHTKKGLRRFCLSILTHVERLPMYRYAPVTLEVMTLVDQWMQEREYQVEKDLVHQAHELLMSAAFGIMVSNNHPFLLNGGFRFLFEYCLEFLVENRFMDDDQAAELKETLKDTMASNR